jgi:hypothetical protein
MMEDGLNEPPSVPLALKSVAGLTASWPGELTFRLTERVVSPWPEVALRKLSVSD